MAELSARNFGLLIAYLIPGFVALWGASAISPDLRLWLTGTSAAGPTIGGFLFVTVAAVAAGMTASAVRWAFLDWLHRLTGVPRPPWDDSALDRKLAAFDYLVENHYRYYQFYGNTFVAVLFSYGIWRLSAEGQGTAPGWTDACVLFVEGVFFAGSRDALRKYFSRTSRLLEAAESEVSHDERQLPRPGSRCPAEPGQETAERSK